MAIFGALAVVVCLLLVFIASQRAPGRQPPKVAAEGGKATFFVRGGETLAGTTLFKMTVAASESGGNPYSSFSGGRDEDVRNILLIDKAKGTSRRILPDNQRHIDSVQFLSAAAEPISADEEDEASLVPGTGQTPPIKPVAYYVLRVRHPAEEGGTPTFDLLVGTLASGRQGYVMRSIDGVESQWMRSPDQLAMIVRDRMGLYYRVVDLPAVKVVESRRIEID